MTRPRSLGVLAVFMLLVLSPTVGGSDPRGFGTPGATELISVDPGRLGDLRPA